MCLNGLYMVLHPQFPAEFPNVRICRGLSPYQARPTLEPNPDQTEVSQGGATLPSVDWAGGLTGSRTRTIGRDSSRSDINYRAGRGNDKKLV